MALAAFLLSTMSIHLDSLWTNLSSVSDLNLLIIVFLGIAFNFIFSNYCSEIRFMFPFFSSSCPFFKLTVWSTGTTEGAG
jgi:hypothetical protein